MSSFKKTWQCVLYERSSKEMRDSRREQMEGLARKSSSDSKCLKNLFMVEL